MSMMGKQTDGIFDDEKLLRKAIKESGLRDADFQKKHVMLDMDRYAREMQRTTDLVVVTDGEIYNMDEVVGHINETGRVSRTDVLIIRNRKEYEKWKGLEMKRTTVHDVQREEDLLGFAVGRAREIDGGI